MAKMDRLARSTLKHLRRLGPKTFLLLIAVVFLPLLILALVNVQLNEGLLSQETEQRQLEMNSIAAQGIESFLAGLQQNLAQIAYTWLDLQPSPQVLQDWLARLSRQNILYQGLWLLDPQGQELARIENDSSVGPLGSRREDELFFRAQRGEVYFSTLRLSGEQPELIISQAIYDDNQQVAGVIAANINLSQTWAIINRLQLGQSGRALLVDRRGNLLTHGDQSLLASRPNYATNPAIANALSTQAQLRVYRYTNPQGQDVLTSAQFIPGPDWVVAIEYPTEEAYQVAGRARQGTLLIFGLAALMALLFSSLLAYLIAQPIYSLRQAAQNYGQEQWEVQLPLHSQDEIGDLARAFQQMGQQLQSSIQALNEQNQALSRATAQAQESTRLKNEFLATISHELRTPLNAVLGYTGILKQGLQGQVDEEARRILNRIEDNGGHLLNIINDILEVSLSEKQGYNLQMQAFDPQIWAQALAQQISPQAAAKGLSFHLDLPPHLPPRLYGDPEALSKVALILLNNALKFTPQGHITLGLKAGPESWQFSVNDTGIGIPEAAQGLIFEQFRQVDQSFRRRYGGTGLGLSIAQNLARAMGGRVWVDSQPGQGSCFIAEFPLSLPDAPPVQG
jgi:signal transduction histidine kinase